jgi:DNA (cytosine-5)-methyltransferase 1
MSRRKTRRRGIAAVDLFCGAAGLSYGLLKEGIDVRAGVDLDGDCRWAYEANTDAQFIHADVAKLDAKVLTRYLPKNHYTLLAGCAPCQRFSRYTQKAAQNERQRWRLLASFSRLALELRPDIITMENVSGLVRHRRFKEFVRALKRSGYFVWHEVIDCFEYGTPQTRKRLVLLGSRLGPIQMLDPKSLRIRKRTVRQVIGKLPAIKAGEVSKRDPLHRSQALSPLNKRRIRTSKPGQSWRTWPKELVLKCHTRATGKSYPSVYGRMEWDKPAPTVTTLAFNYGSGRFGHPEQDRAISLREAAMLQTFPRHYKFWEPRKRFEIRTLARLIGNAVPVALAQAIGRSIVSHVNDVDAARKSNAKRHSK